MRLPPAKTRFVQECERLMTARLRATSDGEREDAEWALTFLFHMNHAGRLDEYFANRESDLGSTGERQG